MIDWLQNPDYAQGEAATLFGDIDRVFSLTGELITQDSLSCMLRVTVGSQRYYVKRYSGSGKNHRRRWFGLRRWFGSPRVRAEWQNLLAFRSWGIPTATLVAYGLERRGGAFTRGAVVTAEIPDSMDLAQINYVNDPRLSDRRWVARVSGKVADIARTLHAARFAHNDLKWRNLLVDGEATVYLIDCPSGGYYRGAFLDYQEYFPHLETILDHPRFVHQGVRVHQVHAIVYTQVDSAVAIGDAQYLVQEHGIASHPYFPLSNHIASGTEIAPVTGGG